MGFRSRIRSWGRMLPAVLLAVAVALGAGLAGCGDGGAQVEPRHIRLGHLNQDLHQLAFYVAMEKGFFSEEGLEVEVAGIYSSGPDEMSAFQAGALDAGYLGMAPAMLAVANGKARVKAVAQANLNGSALVVSPGESIASVADLRGRAVAVPNAGTVQDFLLRRALEGAGMTVADVREVFLAPPEMLAALDSSGIDGCVTWEPFVTRAEVAGTGEVLLDSADIWEDHPCCALVASEDFLQTRPEAVEALRRAHARATAFILDNPEEAARMAASFTGMSEEQAARAMRRITFTDRFNRDTITEYAAFLGEEGLAEIGDAGAFVDAFLYQP